MLHNTHNLNDLIWGVLNNTPWWVYLVLFYLIQRGVAGLKRQISNPAKIFIFPAIMTYFSIDTFYQTGQFTAHNIVLWLGSIVVGIIIGWLFIIRLKLEVDRAQKIMAFPGGPSLLILLIIIFVSKYTLGYLQGVHPELVHNLVFTACNLTISGFFTGMLIGRAVCYLYRYFTLPSVHLNLQSTETKQP